MRRGRGFETRTRITGPRRAGPWESASPGGEDAPDDFTETNVQVEGVDEADIIETDGNRIYFLHGDAFVVVDSWPPEETSLASITPIEGLGHSMFVADGRAVVFSMVYDDEDRFGGEGGCGFIGPPLPLVDAALFGDVAPCLPTFTKLTVLDVAGAPTVVRELYFEGGYTGARRHGGIVRVVVQGGNGLPVAVPDFWNRIYSGTPPATVEEFAAEVDAWEQDAQAAIASSALAEWLPSQWESRNDSLTEIAPTCGAVHLPAVGASENGMTRILALGERIFAVRYIGDRGYIVTFRQVDPLFVIDLSDATRPQLLGELHIPGFSE